MSHEKHDVEIQSASNEETSKGTVIAIQGEPGSNSAVAARQVALLESISQPALLSCSRSAEVLEALADGRADLAVLPIENSLHGSVAEHYDLLLQHPVRIGGEVLLRVQHNIIAAPGVLLEEVRRVLSHPVALSQCRSWFARHPGLDPVPFHDTAGAVRHVVENALAGTAAIAPLAAAEHYGGSVLEEGVEDHHENFTRFLTLNGPRSTELHGEANKLSVAFSLEHRPGTLVRALEAMAGCGLNLTRIESRPVPGTPWEYVFFVDARFESAAQAEAALADLSKICRMLKELGRYRAAQPLS